MGFLDKFFAKETKQEKEIKEHVEGNEETIAKASRINIPTCNGCGQDIEGKPRMIKNNGEILYFHKRCIKAMAHGKLPTPKLVNDNEAQQDE